MRTSAGEILARGRSMPLGIRIALAGSRAFCRGMSAVLAADPDVASVHELDHLGRMNESFVRVNALIVESDFATANLNPAQIEWLSEVSLVAVIGPTLGKFAGFRNAQCFHTLDAGDAVHRISAIKDRVLHIRFQEFSGLVNALVTNKDCEPPSDAESVLELEEHSGRNRIPMSSIDWIRAAGNHIEIHSAGRSHFYRSEMQTIERKLPSMFLRIHRKVIINLDRLMKIDADSSVRHFATLVTGERFLISRHRRMAVHARWAELRGRSA